MSENQSTSRIIAIGDIHGCITAMNALLDRIAPRSDDLFITLGDYVDRGPDSKAVIERAIQLSKQATLIPLIGNHEVMMLGAMDDSLERDFWLACGGDATVSSYGGSLDDVPEGHVAFLKSCRRYYETETHFFVHANYQFDLPLDEQPESIALWEHITHAVPPPHQNGKIAVVGHTPQVDGSIRDVGHLVLMDTYCFGGLYLSAVDFSNGIVWQADEDGKVFEEKVPQRDD